MFVDKAKIMVKGGDGGNGCCSFRREKFVPKGGPDGGDGGGGGHVILRSVTGEQSLVTLVFNRHFKAATGPHGKGKTLHGRKGDDIYINIPVGTIITNVETGELIVDMNEADMEFTVAYGGKGGKGNPRFATSTNRAPMECEMGYPGDELEIFLELKTIADIGLVGFPNAGKSTLLRALSNARPKVAPYPFTTLHPVVGVIDFHDFTRVSVADIPGLIDGAHENIGLGHEFLRHIERTNILAYVLDMAGVDGRNPWEDFHNLRNELELYMKGLSTRPAIVLANKMDLPESAENLELLQLELDGQWEIIPISAEHGGDFEDLKQLLKTRLAK